MMRKIVSKLMTKCSVPHDNDKKQLREINECDEFGTKFSTYLCTYLDIREINGTKNTR